MIKHSLDRLEGLAFRKATAFVTRVSGTGVELLTFVHPLAGTSSQGFLSGGHSSTSTSQQFTARALMTPDEVMNYGQVIVFIAGERPYALQRLNYLTDPEYSGLACRNPYYAAA